MSDHKDYAHIRDPEAQRTRRQLWAIVIIVVVVVAGAVVWRFVAHKPPGPQKGWSTNALGAAPDDSVVGAGAGIHPTSPPPHPVGP